MFTVYQKSQFIYSNKADSPISLSLNFWSDDMSHDHNYTSKYKVTSRLTFMGKIHLFPSILARDIAWSIICSEHTFYPDLKPLKLRFSKSYGFNLVYLFNNSRVC